MKQEHKEFLDNNHADYERVKLNYARNMSADKLKIYEQIYKENISESYILTKWCSDCVFDCIKRVWEFYNNYRALLINNEYINRVVVPVDTILSTDIEKTKFIQEDIVNEKKKRGRKKKS